MFDSPTVYTLGTVVYAVVLAGFVWRTRSVPDRLRWFVYPILAVLALDVVISVVSAFGIGRLVVNGNETVISVLVSDVIAYPTLWGLTALLANVSDRQLAVAVVLPLSQRVAFSVAEVLEGPLALVLALYVIGGHVVLAYFFVGPVWERAQSVSREQRLLHWKTRNLLLFIIGMLVLFGILILTGVFDRFVQAVLALYMNMAIRVGFAAFIFANVTDIDPATLQNALPDRVARTQRSQPSGAD